MLFHWCLPLWRQTIAADMRVGVISDTHGSTHAIDLALKRAGDVEAWIHLGDILSDADYIRRKSGLAVYSVRGNCDGGYSLEDNDLPSDENHAAERVITLDGARLFLCHGHRYRVDWSQYALCLRAEELQSAAALFGHTHTPLLSAYGSLLLLNPGSPYQPRGGAKRTFAVMAIHSADVNARIIPLD